MPFAAVYEYLHTSIANKHKGDARSTSTTLSEQLSTRLDFNDQRIAAPQLVILSGDDEAGTCLVSTVYLK